MGRVYTGILWTVVKITIGIAARFCRLIIQTCVPCATMFKNLMKKNCGNNDYSSLLVCLPLLQDKTTNFLISIIRDWKAVATQNKSKANLYRTSFAFCYYRYYNTDVKYWFLFAGLQSKIMDSSKRTRRKWNRKSERKLWLFGWSRRSYSQANHLSHVKEQPPTNFSYRKGISWKIRDITKHISIFYASHFFVILQN